MKLYIAEFTHKGAVFEYVVKATDYANAILHCETIAAVNGGKLGFVRETNQPVETLELDYKAK
jgi:hypothetical protein